MKFQVPLVSLFLLWMSDLPPSALGDDGDYTYENGDVIDSVSGHPVTSPPDAMNRLNPTGEEERGYTGTLEFKHSDVTAVPPDPDEMDLEESTE